MCCPGYHDREHPAFSFPATHEPTGLREILARLLSDHPTGAAMRAFALLCQRMALLYVRKKVRAGSVYPRFLGLSTADLAMDCVAALFERDTGGRFLQLQVYFNRLHWDQRDEKELLAQTRRLVFSKVNQEFCKLCRENDPSLERILRNIRNAARASPRFTIRRKQGDQWIELAAAHHRADGLPLMPSEYLEAHLMALLSGRRSVPDILDAAGDVLQFQNDYRKAFPLTDLALLIRSAYERLGFEQGAVEQQSRQALGDRDLQRLLLLSVGSVKRRLRKWYMTHHQMDARTYDSYFRAVTEILSAQFLEGGRRIESFYTHLTKFLPALTTEAYRSDHRSRLEYFVKLSRRQFLSAVRTEL